MNLLLDDCHKFYQLLYHKDAYSDLRCVNVEKGLLVDRSILKGWIQVREWLRRYNGQGNCFIGRNPRHINGDVSSLSTFSFDLDSRYDKALGAIPQMLNQCLAAAQELCSQVKGAGLGYSGNGFLVFLPLIQATQVDMGYSLDSFIQLEALVRQKFENKYKEVVRVDKTYDHARMVKFLGTVSCKGARRNSRLLHLPNRFFGRKEIAEVIQSYQILQPPVGGLDRRDDSRGSSGVGDNYKQMSHGQATSPQSSGGDLDKIKHGDMHRELLNFAGACRRRGMNSDAIYNALRVFAEDRCEKPLNYARLLQMATSMMRYEPGEVDNHINIGPEPIVHSFKSSFAAYNLQLSKRGTNKEPDLKTGFPILDSLTWGLTRGDIYTVGAYTGGGKSTWCVNVAHNLCAAGKKVLYLSTELSYDRIFDKFIGLAINVPLSHFQKGLTDDEKARMLKFQESAAEVSFTINDNISPNIGTVRRIVEQSAPEVLIFDHIQQVGEGSASRTGVIAQFLNQLQELARELQFALVIVSQFRRPETYIDYEIKKVVSLKTPTLFDFKECAGIENKSRVAVLLYEKGEAIGADQPVMIFEVAKCSFGKTGKVEMVFDKELGKFKEI